jgi:hypothetical protein
MAWARTEAVSATVKFFKEVLGLEMEKAGVDFWFGRFPECGLVEVFGPARSGRVTFASLVLSAEAIRTVLPITLGSKFVLHRPF